MPRSGRQNQGAAREQSVVTSQQFWNLLDPLSLSDSRRLPDNTAATLVNPVMLLPGRARLSTSPAATGSVTPITIIGIVLAAFLAARAAAVEEVTSTATLSRTISSTSARNRSNLLSADRYSITMFLPST